MSSRWCCVCGSVSTAVMRSTVIGDYFGPTVNRAARLMAAAHGGQIVCSSATAELAASELPVDVTLRHLGVVRLKDLLAPEAVFQVEAPGLATTFPSLRTLDSVRHNLPVQQPRLIGREAETAAVIEALTQVAAGDVDRRGGMR